MRSIGTVDGRATRRWSGTGEISCHLPSGSWAARVQKLRTSVSPAPASDGVRFAPAPCVLRCHQSTHLCGQPQSGWRILPPGTAPCFELCPMFPVPAVRLQHQLGCQCCPVHRQGVRVLHQPQQVSSGVLSGLLCRPSQPARHFLLRVPKQGTCHACSVPTQQGGQ